MRSNSTVYLEIFSNTQEGGLIINLFASSDVHEGLFSFISITGSRDIYSPILTDHIRGIDCFNVTDVVMDRLSDLIKTT